MRESSSAAMKYSVLGWSHLLLLAVGFICSCTTSDISERDNNPLTELSDQVRLRHLYSSNKKTHMYLQITQEGEVGGTQDQNIYSLMEIKAVKPGGIIVVRGKKTSLFLCMDKSRRVYASEAYKEEDCNFREDVRNDGFVLYFSEKHRVPLAIKPPKGGRLKQFLPMMSSIPIDLLYEDTNPVKVADDRTVNVDSEDPLNMLGYKLWPEWEDIL